jgi:hypothetical protein
MSRGVVRGKEATLRLLSVVPPYAQCHPPKGTEHQGFDEDVDKKNLKDKLLRIHVHPLEASFELSITPTGYGNSGSKWFLLVGF